MYIFSGLMYSKDYSLQSVPEIVAHSGFALLHFYSDIAYNLSGFNISYRYVKTYFRMLVCLKKKCIIKLNKGYLLNTIHKSYLTLLVTIFAIAYLQSKGLFS